MIYFSKDIFITNMDNVSFDIHEDTTDETTLHVIATSDDNVDDSVSCEIDEANSVPSNNGRFTVQETFPGSEGTGVASRFGICSK